jgi:hypothetical protein
MPSTTVFPESCAKCPFFERTKHARYGSFYNCRYYNKGGASKKGKKFPFCKVKFITVGEKELRLKQSRPKAY